MKQQHKDRPAAPLRLSDKSAWVQFVIVLAFTAFIISPHTRTKKYHLWRDNVRYDQSGQYPPVNAFAGRASRHFNIPRDHLMSLPMGKHPPVKIQAAL
ncbi:MAG: hypothetical protein PHO37_09850 [Kiritimatiellae bacterium]|nr:hypothetical protein [Kiritimatiellia bacterium]